MQGRMVWQSAGTPSALAPPARQCKCRLTSAAQRARAVHDALVCNHHKNLALLRLDRPVGLLRACGSKARRGSLSGMCRCWQGSNQLALLRRKAAPATSSCVRTFEGEARLPVCTERQGRDGWAWRAWKEAAAAIAHTQTAQLHTQRALPQRPCRLTVQRLCAWRQQDSRLAHGHFPCTSDQLAGFGALGAQVLCDCGYILEGRVCGDAGCCGIVETVLVAGGAQLACDRVVAGPHVPGAGERAGEMLLVGWLLSLSQAQRWRRHCKHATPDPGRPRPRTSR